MKTGYIHVYTGPGKGKTTCCLGLALRAAGAGMRVLFAQFLKQGTFAELTSLRLLQNITVCQYGRHGFITGVPDPADRDAAQEGFRQTAEAIIHGRYDCIILDELNVAVRLGLIEESAVCAVLTRRKPSVEIVLSGRDAPDAFIEMADLVTEMNAVKHYYDQGVPARRGIEM